MSLIVQAAPPEHFGWICSRSSIAPARDFTAIEAVDPRTGAIRGMIGYENWTPNSVQMHMAVDSPIVWRSLIQPGFRYPLLDAGRNVLIGVTPSDNPKALAVVRHFGFREVHRIVDGWSVGVDLVITEMRRHECRWLKEGN